jgi:hypothetical protein
MTTFQAVPLGRRASGKDRSASKAQLSGQHNLDDLLYLRHVDAVMTQSDVFEYFRTQRKTPNLENRFITSFACPFRRCTSLPAPTSKASRICAARKSASDRQELLRA